MVQYIHSRQKIFQLAPRAAPPPPARCRTVQTQEILVTLAERPHPFPSRTRKLSSPAPKILRGQPFGKIGRRQDFCVSAVVHRAGFLAGGYVPGSWARVG